MKIVLASNSPRRREILSNIGLEYEVIPSTVEEKINDFDIPAISVMSLAFQKAIQVAELHPNTVVIGADTVVVLEGSILGKPRDDEDAMGMLRCISGREHCVYTGYAIVNVATNKKVVNYEVTRVRIRELDEDTMSKYIATGEPHDKAGAYAIQGFGALIVDGISGDYFNVVGLPIKKLSDDLKNHFGIEIF